jgi:hypothetical protein
MDPTIGALAVEALSIAAKAALQGTEGETVKDAYKALKHKIAQRAEGDVTALEKAPDSKERQEILTKEIDKQLPQDLAQIRSLATALIDEMEKRQRSGPIGVDIGRLEAMRVRLGELNVVDEVFLSIHERRLRELQRFREIGLREELANGMSGDRPAREHVVLIVHGIRTRAEWASMVKRTIEDATNNAMTVRLAPYGRFSLWRFLLPGPTRWDPVKIVTSHLRDARERGQDHKKKPSERLLISVIAHSYGTYCLFRALKTLPNIRMYRVILCGSVLPQTFKIDLYEDQLGLHEKRHEKQSNNALLNECGDWDPWPVLAKKVTWGYGSSGTFGLFNGWATNRFHQFGHTAYFDAAFVKDMWVPFLERGVVIPSPWETSGHIRFGNPWWIRLLDWLPLKSATLALLIAYFPVSVTEYFWRPAPRLDDCGGTNIDIDSSIPRPNNDLKPEDIKCNRERLHSAAVCWKDHENPQPPFKALEGKPDFCLYRLFVESSGRFLGLDV